jgi:glucose-1-phosphate thymidylyltransferase
MKGIILAGGNATRLYPITHAISKQLLPVYDKPMVYYPLSTLMRAGIRDILVITTPRDKHLFEALLGDGNRWGISLSYQEQSTPGGIAQAFLIGKDFVGDESCALALGDNLFFGENLGQILKSAAKLNSGATILCHEVAHPSRFGVVEFDSLGNPKSIIEKPENPRSNWIITGLYFFDNSVVELASSLKPSARGELEITDIHNAYLERGKLTVERLGQEYSWYDAGTFDSLLQASSFVQSAEKAQDLKIACLEQIAYREGFIDRAHLKTLATNHPDPDMAEFLLKVANDG